MNKRIVGFEHDSDAYSNPYSRLRLNNLVGQFKCDWETAVRIQDYQQAGHTLEQAAKLAGALKEQPE